MTTVRRVCRTLEIGPYAPSGPGIKRSSAQCPFGWTSQKCRLVKDAAEWRWVERMAALRQAGSSLHEIARHLTDLKVPTKNGGRWFARTVSQILKFNELHFNKSQEV